MVGVMAVATLLPLVWESVEVVQLCNMLFYAASLLVPYDLLAGAVKWFVQAGPFPWATVENAGGGSGGPGRLAGRHARAESVGKGRRRRRPRSWPAGYAPRGRDHSPLRSAGGPGAWRAPTGCWSPMPATSSFGTGRIRTRNWKIAGPASLCPGRRVIHHDPTGRRISAPERAAGDRRICRRLCGSPLGAARRGVGPGRIGRQPAQLRLGQL